MATLLDTNILLRILQPHSPHAPIAERALDALRSRGETLHITSQNLVEFWAVATRPAMENGLGLTVEQTMGQVQALKRLFALLPEAPLQNEWERLVTTYRVSGRNSHDARLAAAMMVHGIRNILTFNVAPIISLSFGNCEAVLGSGNQFLSNLYEQAAAQGITVLVSSGDSGSATCDSSGAYYATQGQAVSGFASTPFNVAVGGTDFYYSAYNSNSTAINNQLESYWSFTPSNGTPAVSILGVIPEQPWNNSQYGLNLYNEYTGTNGLITTIAAGGGGASNAALCSSAYDSSNACTGTLSGYPKPAWQSGNGVPSDGVRDLPDLSLFAANGVNYSYYPICYYDGDCQPASGGQTVQFTGVGGTSASTPAFAGIMAMVNQQYGRQGQANYVLYPLATQFPESFHDVAVGTNSVPCDVTTTGCIPVSNPAIIDKIPLDPSSEAVTEGQIGAGTTASYNAGPGYNLATGLGTVDAANLVKNWNKVSLAATKTTLAPSQTSFAHGTAIDISGAVTSAGGTPTGDVALMTNSTERVQQGQTFFTLSGGSYSGSLNYLPGGTYDIWGQYGGDKANGLSSSAPVQISVTPESSTTNLFVEDMTDYVYIPSGSSNISYGKMLVLDAQPVPSSNSSKTFTSPTGTVTFADNGTPLPTVVLNSIGEAELQVASAIGDHSITVSYSGDQSYSPSISAASTFSTATVTPQIGFTWETPAAPPTPGSGDGTNHLDVQVWNSAEPPAAYTAQPTGTVTLSSTPAGIAGTGTLIPSTYGSLASFNIQAPPGSYQVTVNYSGDANYSAVAVLVTSYAPPVVVSAPGSALTSTTNATLTGSISPTTSILVNGTVTGQSGQPAPTGELLLSDVGNFLYGVLLTPGSGDASTFSFVLDSQFLVAGKNFLSFQYLGDSVYNGSLFVVANPILDTLSDFTLAPDSSIIPLAAGNSTADTINLTSVNSFSGAVAFTCTVPSAITCTTPPSVSLAAAGVATTSVTIGAAASTPLGSYDVLIAGTDPTGKYVHTLGLTAIVGNAISGSKGFMLTNSGNITMTAGATTGNTSTVTIAPTNGFSGTVALSCAVTTSMTAPQDMPTCSLAQSSVSVNGVLSPKDVLTVSTTAATKASRNQPAALFWHSAGGTALALLFLVLIPRRRRSWPAMIGLLVLALSVASLGCNSIIYTNRTGGSGTTAGAYTITVTGTSGSISQSTALTVTVN